MDPLDEGYKVAEGVVLRLNPVTDDYFLDLFDLTNRSRILDDKSIMCESSDPDIASVNHIGGAAYTWNVFGHSAGTATITLGFCEFRRTFDVKVTDYKVYFEGKEAQAAGNNYFMGTNQGDVFKFSLFDNSTKSFLKTTDWKINILIGATYVDVSYTDTECLFKAKSAGFMSINVIDTSDAEEFLIRNLGVTIKN